MNTDEIVKNLTNDVKNNKELLQAIANFVCCRDDVTDVEFVECVSSYDAEGKKRVMLILDIENERIAIEFKF